ncbi:isoprenyl transferase, partial [Caulobacter endophyticus]
MSPKTGLQTKTARPGGEAGAGLHAAIIMDGNGRWAKR